MGFCRRCGDILTSARCSKCGGSNVQSSVSDVLAVAQGRYGGAGAPEDRWSRKYIQKRRGSSSTVTSTNGGANNLTPSSSMGTMNSVTDLSSYLSSSISTPSRGLSPSPSSSGLSIANPGSLSSNRRFLPSASSSRSLRGMEDIATLPAEQGGEQGQGYRFAKAGGTGGEKYSARMNHIKEITEGATDDYEEEEQEVISRVFGSVLDPIQTRSQWKCHSCSKIFPRDDTIFPDPRAADDPDLKEVFYCRTCFEDKFSRGDCDACGHAVLGDKPFVCHGNTIWHSACYRCTYCSRDISRTPMVDLYSQPCCEACFDSNAGAPSSSYSRPRSASNKSRSPVSVPFPDLRKTGGEGGSGIPVASGADARRRTRSAVSTTSLAASSALPPHARGGSSSLRDPAQDVSRRPRNLSTGSEEDRDTRMTTANAAGFDEESMQGVGIKDRLRRAREASPIAPAMSELRRKLQAAGLEKAPTMDSGEKEERERKHSMQGSGMGANGRSRTPVRDGAQVKDMGDDKTPRPGARNDKVDSRSYNQPQRGSSVPFPSPDRDLASREGQERGRASPSTGPPPPPLHPNFDRPVRPGGRTRSTPSPIATAPSNDRPSSSGIGVGRGGGSPSVLSNTSASTTSSSFTSSSSSYLSSHDSRLSSRSGSVSSMSSHEHSQNPHVPNPKDDKCHSCHLPLFSISSLSNNAGDGGGEMKIVTLPRTSEKYHWDCFRCFRCGEVFENGRYVAMEDGGVAHEGCAPPIRVQFPIHRSTSPEKSASPVPSTQDARDQQRKRTSSFPRDRSNSSNSSKDVVPTPTPQFDFNKPTLVPHSAPERPPSLSKPSSLVSKRSSNSPLPKFGGLHVCPGCGKSGSLTETVQGPVGRRWHSKCLKCCGVSNPAGEGDGIASWKRGKDAAGRECGKKLDSGAKVDEEGRVRCRDCHDKYRLLQRGFASPRLA